MYQTKSGLARHIKVNHQQSDWENKIIDKDFMFFLASTVKQSGSENLCYKDSVRNATRNYDFESYNKLLENVNHLYMRLQKSNDPDAFYSSCTSLIFSNTERFFTTMDHFSTTLTAMTPARQIHQEFLKQKKQSTTHTQKALPLTINELDGFQYLCGYVAKNLLNKFKNHKNYKTEQYQIMIAILEGICTDNHYQKIINCLSRGDLTAVHNGCLPISFMKEELFRKDTMGNPQKIDVADMVGQLTTKPEVISIFNNIVEESGFLSEFFARIEN